MANTILLTLLATQYCFYINLNMLECARPPLYRRLALFLRIKLSLGSSSANTLDALDVLVNARLGREVLLINFLYFVRSEFTFVEIQ